MGRVLRADQIPESVARAEGLGVGVAFEDFDAGAGGDNLFSESEFSPEASSRRALSENIIRAAELQAKEIIQRAKRRSDKKLEEADAELARARAEAKRMLEEAETESAGIYDRARQEGYEKGAAQGQKAAFEERTAELDQLVGALQKLIDEIPPFREKLIVQSEAEVLELVLVIATKIVGFELSIRPDLILEVVKSGIELLKNKREISIRLSPADIALVKELRAELLEEFHQIHLTVDESLIAGECLIENKTNLVDSTWRRKISNAAEMVWELYNKRTAASQNEMTNATAAD
jgi:flagellar assembly protein FliH